jgi:hypothetical protein
VLVSLYLLGSNFYPSFFTSLPLLRIEHDVIVRLEFLLRQRISSFTRQASLAKDQHIERSVSLQDNTRGLLFGMLLCDSRWGNVGDVGRISLARIPYGVAKFSQNSSTHVRVDKYFCLERYSDLQFSHSGHGSFVPSTF